MKNQMNISVSVGICDNWVEIDLLEREISEIDGDHWHRAMLMTRLKRLKQTISYPMPTRHFDNEEDALEYGRTVSSGSDEIRATISTEYQI